MKTRFDRASHRYWIDGVEVPGTTEVLKVAGWYEGVEFMPVAARDRGSAVHDLVRWHVLGLLELADEDSWLRPYLLAFEAFERDSGFELEGCERPVFYRRDGMAFGTHVDLTGCILGQQNREFAAVIDIKSGAKDETVGPQTAAQVMGLDGRVTGRDRYALYLRPNGTYRLDRLIDGADFRRWQEAYAVWDEARKGVA